MVKMNLISAQPGQVGATWVTAYRVTRHYGGPEEGGWWYNQGEVVASVPVYTAGQEEAAEEHLKAACSDVQEGDIYSVLGGTALEVHRTRKQGRDWPEERPHYE